MHQLRTTQESLGKAKELRSTSETLADLVKTSESHYLQRFRDLTRQVRQPPSYLGSCRIEY